MDEWDFSWWVLTGGLLFVLTLGAARVHVDTEQGWTPPAVLDRRQALPLAVPDWPSPAKVRRAAGPETAPRPVERRSSER
jgi:hypothetical protein